VPTALIGTDAFQEADIVSMTMPITKHSYSVRDAEDIPRIVHEAFHIAGTGRKGPVLIDIPKDVSNASIRYATAREPHIRGYEAAPEVNSGQLDTLLRAIAESKKPLMIAGAGVVHSDASAELIRFVNAAHVPVASTLLGLSGFPSGHPYSLGMAGHHGNYAANMAIQNADLIISIGSRFDDRLTMRVSGFAPNARLIAHLDIDPAEIGKNVKTDIGIVGDIKAALAYANARLAAEAAHSGPPADRGEWLRQIERWKAEHPLRYADSDTELKPQFVLEMIHEQTQGNAIVTTDVGQHQMWAAQFYRFNHPRSLLTSGGLGTMGFGFPAAIGAQIGNPDRLVVSINGDGGMQMCAQELAICALHRIPVKIVVLNNRVLGMVRQQQEIMYERHYSQIDLSGSPDFVKLAEAYGIKGLRASSKADAIRVWKEAMQTDGPVLVEFEIPTDENVYPMVVAGSALDEMILGDFVE